MNRDFAPGADAAFRVIEYRMKEHLMKDKYEGVLVVDSEKRVINMNGAAAEMIGIDADCVGRRVQDVIRDADIRDFVTDSFDSDGLLERELVVIDGAEQKYVQAHSIKLGNVGAAGTVIVLNDVTRWHRLDKVRRDFITNVSHELKTPITSIKGYVDMLLNCAADDPDNARRFLKTVARQADQLNTIVNGLLELSRIEKEIELNEIVFETGPLRGVMLAAVKDCEVQARERNVSVELVCDSDVESRRNPYLLEQAVANLIDNAIKYSEPDTKVRVEVVQEDDEIAINVTDDGCGIQKLHLVRLFERFYCVDKARSRDSGGTGLGLAIVKHIARAHGGRATAESTPGRGSEFTIHIPRS